MPVLLGCPSALWRRLRSLEKNMLTCDWLTRSVLALSLWIMTLSSNGNRTCHKTACQVLASSIEPWAAMVENRVCPELFLTEGRVSRHKSRNLQYKHIHSLSKDDMFLLPGKERKHSGNNICWSLS